jgi:hypothetical protein
MRRLKLLIYLNIMAFSSLSIGNSEEVKTARLVAVAKAERVVKAFELSLMAEVSDKNFSDNISRRSYHLSIELPHGLIPSIRVGSNVKISLPTIHKNVALAQVTSISKTHVQLILANQIQQLEGQKLKAEIPFLAVNLFKIPFQAIYSPRGTTSEVFILSSDMKVQLVKITPLQITNDGNVIISSEQLKDSLIVVQGTDNLLSGDIVKVNKESGAML